MKSSAPHETGAMVDPPSDNALRGFLGYNLKRAYLAVHPAAKAAMTEFGLRVPSFSCLSVIVENPGIAPSVLAEYLKMERSNIVVIIDELESRELVNRTRSTVDRRRFALTATVRGHRIHEQTVGAICRHEQ